MLFYVNAGQYRQGEDLPRICKTEAVTESLVSFRVLSQRHRRACRQLVCHESRINIIADQILYVSLGRGKYILHRTKRNTSSSVDGGSQTPGDGLGDIDWFGRIRRNIGSMDIQEQLLCLG